MKRLMRVVLIMLVGASAGFTCEDREPGAVVVSGWGGDLHNTHHFDDPEAPSPADVSDLEVRWMAPTTGNVSAFPSVSTSRIYAVDWGVPLLGGSHLYAIDRDDGGVVRVEAALGYTTNLINSVVRTTPTIAGDLMVFGDMRNQPSSILSVPGGHGAVLYAVERDTGALRWRTVLDPHPLAIVTQSPTIHDGRIYVGVSSHEEAAARLGYPCCSFRGSMLAVDLATGAIVWRRPMTPPASPAGSGFSGAAVWGSAPAIDEARGVVYVATGNNYTFPDALERCVAEHVGDPIAQQGCFDAFDPPDNLAEAVVALDLATGAVRWARKMHNSGAWTFACDPALVPWLPLNLDNCEDLQSQDFDFGQAPMLVTTADGAPQDLVLVGQKSGVFYALDPDADGATVWATAVGPGGVLGGMEFGAATDGARVYTQITNFEHVEFPLVAGPDAGRLVRGGIWAALDVATGAIVWQTADPASELPLDGHIFHPTWGGGLGPGFFGVAMGPMSVANGVVYAGSMAGQMHALDAATGEILWTHDTGSSVMSAPMIVDGTLYWGTGYSTGTNGSGLYAFAR